MISQTAQYLLGAIVYLADSSHVPQTLRSAEAPRVPADYLGKVMQRLNRSGQVRAAGTARGL